MNTISSDLLVLAFYGYQIRTIVGYFTAVIWQMTGLGSTQLTNFLSKPTALHLHYHRFVAVTLVNIRSVVLRNAPF